MNKLLSSLLLFIVTTSVCAFDKDKLDAYLATIEANDKAMLSVAIAKDGKPVYQRAIGFADIASQKKANTDTLYRIGSITKVFTSVMIFQLIDEGKLSLTTPLAQFYPDVKNASDITIAMLLSHRSGIHNFTNVPDYVEYMTQPKTKQDMLSIIEAMDSDFPPGSKASYSNSGYVLLGYILEDVTGDSYANQLKQRITSKLGLQHTVFGEPIQVQFNHANSYSFRASSWTPATITDMSIPHAAGAISATPTDVAVFLSQLFEGKLLSATSLAKMKEINQGYGHGLFQFPFFERKAYGHTGGIDGFSSQSAYFESDDVAVVLTANGLNYPQNDISIGVLSLYFGIPFEVPDLSSRAITLAEDLLTFYQGIFASNAMPLKITLKVTDGQLTAQATGQPALPLTPFSTSEFRFEPAGIIISFEQTEDGINYGKFLLKQGGGTYSFNKE